MKRPPLLAALAVLALTACPVGAQPVTPPGAPPDTGPGLSSTGIITTGISYHVYRRPGEATIQLYVVGASGSTGIYVVGSETTLSEMMALIGSAPASVETEMLERTARVRVLREQGDRRLAIYEATTEEALAEPGTHPPLMDRDMIAYDVELQQRTSFLQVVEVAARFATLTLLFLRLAEYF